MSMSGVEHERGGLMEVGCSDRREHVTVHLHLPILLSKRAAYLEISLKRSARQAVVLPAF